MSSAKVTGLSFLGVRTDRKAELRSLFTDALGMDVFFENDTFVAMRLPDGSVVEIFSAADEAHAHFDTGPVAGFEVDDVDDARTALTDRGVEVGPVHVGSKGSRWIHFRGPDGHVYELLESAPAIVGA